MYIEYRSSSSFMIPIVVSSFRSPHSARAATGFSSHHLPRLLPGLTYGVSLVPLATRYRLFRTPGGSQLLYSPSYLRLRLDLPPQGVLYARTCMRAHTRAVPFRCAYIRACSRAYVRTCMCITQSVHHTLPSRAFSRSLHRCRSCTRESCRCSRQALPGRVSLSGNVPTEQPTLALTLCPFRGVLWRESSASLSFSLALSSLPSSHPRTPSFLLTLLLTLVGHPLAPIPTSLSVSLFSSCSNPTPPRSPLHG